MKEWRFKDGRPIHDGDCHFWGEDICTCGLLHQLIIDPPDEEWYWIEHAKHETQLERIPERLPYVPPSAEEIAKRTKFLEEFNFLKNS